MKKVLFLVNHDVVIYNFRLEIVERLLNDGHEVHISSPYGERIDDLVRIGSKFHEINFNRHGFNPLQELKLLNQYNKLINKIKPDIILGFTIKPNIYGAIAARKNNVPFVANITGLGTALEDSSFKQKVLIYLYRYAFKNVQKVFFQNEENKQFFIKNKIIKVNYDLLPGSGVNLKKYNYYPYPQTDKIEFAFISRIMKEKGIDQYLDAAQEIIKRYHNIYFHICGFCEEEYKGKLVDFVAPKHIQYHGMIRDVSSFMKKMHCIIHPTYYPEGISNVLLEACATGRPIITTNRSGCREVIDDNINGYIVPAKDSMALINVIEKFISLPSNKKVEMGLNGRKKVERYFDRQIVVNKYLDEIM